MEDLTKLKNSLREERPVEWKSLPDIELYMDQLINYMPRQQVAYREESALTAAMVNNYIKDGLIPHPNGKRYSREHLAMLTAVCICKQVLSVKDISLVLNEELKKLECSEFYGKLMGILDEALTETSALIPEELDEDKLSDTVLRLAIAGYANKLACEHLLDIMRSKNAEPVTEAKKTNDKHRKEAEK